LIIIGGLILVGFISSFIYWLQLVKPESEVSVLPEEKTETPKEISQEEATALALEKYPGEVFSIEKKTFESEKELEESQTYWIIGINLVTPLEIPSIGNEVETINKAWIKVDINTKEMSIHKLGD